MGKELSVDLTEIKTPPSSFDRPDKMVSPQLGRLLWRLGDILGLETIYCKAYKDLYLNEQLPDAEEYDRLLKILELMEIPEKYYRKGTVKTRIGLKRHDLVDVRQVHFVVAPARRKA